MGLHKTGTTSLQTLLSCNKEILKKQGFYYPISSLFTVNHSIPIYSAFCSFPENYHINIKQGLSKKEIINKNKNILNEFNKILQNNNKIIISGEDISVLNTDELKKFKSFIEKYNYKIIPIVIIRSPYSWYCSRIQETIKSGNYVDYIKYDNILIDRIIKIKSIFDNTIFIPYNKKHKLGTVGLIMDLLSINYSNFKLLDKKENESYSNLTIREKNMENKLNPVIINGVINKNYNQQIKIINDHKPFRLNKYELSLVIDKIKKENEYLMKELGEEFCDIDYSVCD